MHPSIRRQIARGLAAAAALSWAVAWGLPALWSLVGGVDLYHQNSAMGQWLHGIVPLRENTFVCLRDMVVAAIPAGALLAAGRRAGTGAEAPRAWRPAPLLATLLVIATAQSALVAGAFQFDWWSPSFMILMDLVPAVMCTAALAVLLRRFGPVRDWDGGALLTVGTLAVGAAAGVISALEIGWLVFGPGRFPPRPELPLQLAHWPLALGLAALACRWVLTRPGPKPRGAYVVAVLAGFVFPVVLMMNLGQVFLLPILLLAMLVAGQWLQAWSERETPRIRVALQG